jgi:ribonuclease E
MVDEYGTTAEAAPAPEGEGAAPRRRRRAASRPAGPPAHVDGAAEQPTLEDAQAADEAPIEQVATQPEGVATEPDAGVLADEPDSAGTELIEGDGADDEQAAPGAAAEEPAGEPSAVAPSSEEPSAVATPTESAPTESASTESASTESASTESASPEAPTSTSGRRPRRATRGVTTVAFSGGITPEPVVAVTPPAEVQAIALFQPPDETKAVRRRRSRGADSAGGEQTSAAEGPGATSDEAPAPVEADQPTAPDSGDAAADLGGAGDLEGEQARGDDDRDDDSIPRRRRRRGGRRRRRAGQGGTDQEGQEGPEGPEDSEQEGSGDESAEAPAGAEGAGRDGADGAADSTAAQDAEEPDQRSDEEGGGSRRRRRRRRRAGVAEEMEDLSSDDQAGTVVKVREGRRAASDEITSVRGSTRIEAKRQRRRDGREAGRRRAPILTEAEFLARRESVNRVMCVREHGDRTQIAVLEDGILVEHYVNRAESSSMVGNVYLGKVQNVLPSMEAAFVDIGRGRNAVLYAGEVNWDAAGMEGQPKRIELALKSGDPVLVQVTKDPIGHKGARLTSQISLPGRFLVYVPEGSMTGISRKLPDTERSRLKGILRDIVPDGAGVIVRTAAEGATEEQLTSDVTRLTAQWSDITKKARSASPPTLLYGEPDLAIKVVRDIFNEDFTTLLVQGDSTWHTLDDYIGWVAPDLRPKLEKWVEPTDLYAAHRIDEQLAKALDRKVWLPSGGSLVIDRTEAMTVVDVNTGKFTGQGGNLEETVTRNNLEAAEEIVRQLRLRDIGGIVVIDFIDMVLESNRDLVLRRLVECLGRDRTKHQVAEVTSLGLVQMTRKRIGQGLLEVFSTPCDACGGRGHVVHAEPVGAGHEAEEPSGRRDRDRDRGRRAKPQPPVNLGGKQTGKTPPPPKFDEHGHIHHDEDPRHPQQAGTREPIEVEGDVDPVERDFDPVDAEAARDPGVVGREVQPDPDPGTSDEGSRPMDAESIDPEPGTSESGTSEPHAADGGARPIESEPGPTAPGTTESETPEPGTTDEAAEEGPPPEAV